MWSQQISRADWWSLGEALTSLDVHFGSNADSKSGTWTEKRGHKREDDKKNKERSSFLLV